MYLNKEPEKHRTASGYLVSIHAMSSNATSARKVRALLDARCLAAVSAQPLATLVQPRLPGRLPAHRPGLATLCVHACRHLQLVGTSGHALALLSHSWRGLPCAHIRTHMHMHAHALGMRTHRTVRHRTDV